MHALGIDDTGSALEGLNGVESDDSIPVRGARPLELPSPA
ncbi:MAG: hypothetical protein K0S65_3252, partial [Labilithrix sp.]|nr:hypothetical protein [Labilithrix sp.]